MFYEGRSMDELTNASDMVQHLLFRLYAIEQEFDNAVKADLISDEQSNKFDELINGLKSEKLEIEEAKDVSQEARREASDQARLRAELERARI